MITKCEKCGQTVMVSDSACWHCGAVLEPANNSESSLPSLDTAVSPDALSQPTIQAIFLYAGLTAVSLLLIILTTRAIGQAPLLFVGSGSNPLAGWKPVTNSQLQFTLNLPETWLAHDLTTSTEAESILTSPPVSLLNASFETLVVDSKLIWFGSEPDNGIAFVLVARSERLQLLSAEQFILYSQEQFPSDLEIVEAEVVNTDWGTPKVNFQFAIEQAGEQWLCQGQFVPTDKDAYLVTACTELAHFSDYAADFGIILRSFQPLDS